MIPSRIVASMEKNIVLTREKRDELVAYSKVAMATGRYDDMASCINFVVKYKHLLNMDEIKLFTMAFGKTTNARRSALQIIDGILQRETSQIGQQNIIKYKKEVELELQEICYTILNLLDYHIFIENYNMETKIIFCKLRADCYAYLVPVISGDRKQDMVIRGQFAYYAVYELCRTTLSAAHPRRLEVALSVSAFHKHILNTPAEALYILKEAIYSAKKVFEETNTFLDSAGLFQYLQHVAMEWDMQYTYTYDATYNSVPAIEYKFVTN